MARSFALVCNDQQVSLTSARTFLGTEGGSLLPLRGWRIGRRHAELFVAQSTLFVRDLASRTGTFVNGKKLDDAMPLADGDVLDIGGTHIRVLVTSPTPTRGIPDQTPEAKPGVVDTHPHVERAHPVARVPASPPQQASAPPQTAAPAHHAPPAVDSAAMASHLKYRTLCSDRLRAAFDLRRIDTHRMKDDELRQVAEENTRKIIAEIDNLPSFINREQLLKEVCDEAVGLGPLESMLEDSTITEVMVNRYDEVFVEQGGQLSKWPVYFTSDKAVMGIIERIVAPLGRRIDESSPLVDARLKDGSRVNAIIPPLAIKGPSLTIRKFSKKRLGAEDLLRFGSANEEMVEFLRICVEHHKNVLISGGTGSGKTTLLNILSNFIPDGDRVVTIEDAAELQLHHPNIVNLEARPANIEGKGQISIRDLVKNALRMRPDRIVVGECRGGEALDMLQAMNTGHDGSLTTAHANSPRDMLARLEVMVLMAGMDLPVTAIREQVASAVDIIVQQTRFACGTRKITNIAEVTGVESGKIQLQEVFSFVQTGRDAQGKTKGFFTGRGFIPEFYEELRAIGVPVRIDIFGEHESVKSKKIT